MYLTGSRSHPVLSCQADRDSTQGHVLCTLPPALHAGLSFRTEGCAMATERKSPGILVFAVILALTLMMAAPAVSAMPDPATSEPNGETTLLPTPAEPTAPLTVKQKRGEKKKKNTKKKKKTAKKNKKKGAMRAMLLTLFAIVNLHQGALR